MTLTGLLLGLVASLLKMGVEIAMAFITAIPMTIIWNRLLPVYADGVLPARFLHLPFWHVFGALLLTVFVGEIINRLTPKIVSVTSESKSEKK